MVIESAADVKFLTVGDLRKAMADYPDDLPLHFRLPGGDFTEGAFGVIGDDGQNAPAFATIVEADYDD